MRGASHDRSLSAEAYTVIRHRILCGQISLGEPVSRRKLAAELGMSFLPVTQALLRLELEGFLESRPRAGTRVRIPSREDVLGHYVVREALETQAARLCAQRATPEERAALLKLAARVDACVLTDHVMFMGLHEKLHRRIADCAHTAALSKAIEETHALASTWFCIIPSPLPDYSRHQELVKTLAEESPDLAAETMREHVVRGLEQMTNMMTPFFKMRKIAGETYPRRRALRKRVSSPNPE
jgi:GntR family transcriptional regulator, rspAB operon transcriptional repressor